MSLQLMQGQPSVHVSNLESLEPLGYDARRYCVRRAHRRTQCAVLPHGAACWRGWYWAGSLRGGAGVLCRAVVISDRETPPQRCEDG